MRRRAGFTLIEVLIAVAVMAMITGMLWYSFSQTFKAIDRVQEDADMYRQARQVTSRVPGELAGAFLPTITSPTSQVKYEFVAEDDGDTDRVRFVSIAHTKLYTDANESDQAEIEYFTEPDRKRPGLYRVMRRVDAVPDDRPEEGGATFVVAEGVKEFNLSWYDANKDTWVDYWDTTKIEHNQRLPYSVRLLVTMVDSRGEDRTWATAAMIRLAKPSDPR